MLLLAQIGAVGRQQQVRIIPSASWVEIYFEAIDASPGALG
jgi:hypothetical protein